MRFFFIRLTIVINLFLNVNFVYANSEPWACPTNIEEVNKNISSNPNDSSAYEERVVYYRCQGDCIRAISDYNKIIEINSSGVSIGDMYYGRAECYKDLYKYDQAVSDYTKALKLLGGSPGGFNWDKYFGEIYFERGMAYFGEKEYNKAWIDLHEAEALGYKPDQYLKFLYDLRVATGRDK